LARTQIYSRQLALVLALPAILAAATFLRFYDLRDNPGWYSDEGSDINIAANLLAGRLQYFAIGESPMIAARPLLFHAILAGGFALLGEDIWTIRALTAACGVLSTVLLFVLARRLAGTETALLASALFAIYPSAILYSRFGFTYNLLTPLFLLFCYCLHRYAEHLRARWLISAALISGLAMITNPLALVLPVILLLVILICHRQHWPWLLVAASLPIVYGGVMMILSREAFLFDLSYTFSRFNVSLPLQLVDVIFHYQRLWYWDPWTLAGAIGLFMIPRRRARALALAFFFITLFSVARVATLDSLGFYRLIPLFPFVALGIAVLLVRGLPVVLRLVIGDVQTLFLRLGWHAGVKLDGRLHQRALGLSVSLILFFTLLSPFLATMVLDVYWAATRFPSGFSWAVAQEPSDAQQAIDYVNSHTMPTDVVLASPYVAWALDGSAADFQQALAYQGIATAHLPGNIPRERFLFDCSLSNARYVVLDELWRTWASEAMPEVKDMVSIVETWPLEMRFGEFEIYRNPASASERG
jgi:4-amino-4-deoxy-L-arabinose transferase-like glycosyltransferase